MLARFMFIGQLRVINVLLCFTQKMSTSGDELDAIVMQPNFSL
jgi:Trk-type K+ transport system membrane component